VYENLKKVCTEGYKILPMSSFWMKTYVKIIDLTLNSRSQYNNIFTNFLLEVKVSTLTHQPNSSHKIKKQEEGKRKQDTQHTYKHNIQACVAYPLWLWKSKKYYIFCGPGSSVSRATDYGLDGPGMSAVSSDTRRLC
jgi:hypothetical protein